MVVRGIGLSLVAYTRSLTWSKTRSKWLRIPCFACASLVGRSFKEFLPSPSPVDRLDKFLGLYLLVPTVAVLVQQWEETEELGSQFVCQNVRVVLPSDGSDVS